MFVNKASRPLGCVLSQELVGARLEAGLNPLWRLPAAVAAEVVDEMRAAAAQAGPSDQWQAGPAMPLMLDDGSGSGLSWKVRPANGSSAALTSAGTSRALPAVRCHRQCRREVQDGNGVATKTMH